MTKIAIAALAAITLAGQALSVAHANQADTGSKPKPSSFAPQPRTDHVYGAPIQPPIVGHANPSHHKHAHKNASTSATTRNAPKSPLHHGKAKTE